MKKKAEITPALKKRTIICIGNHKGGVGKTTLAVNLSRYLLPYASRILVIDTDPQANATKWLAQTTPIPQVTISDILKFALKHDLGKETAQRDLEELFLRASIDTVLGGNKIVSLLPSNLDLAQTKIELSSHLMEAVKYFRIKAAIRHISQKFDIVLIDSPPQIELLTWASIASADYLLIPVTFDPDSIDGANNLLDEILPSIRKTYNPDTRFLGVVINTYSQNTRISNLSEEMIREAYSNKVFDTVVSRSQKIAELKNFRETLDRVSPSSKSAKEIKALADEIVKRIAGGSHEDK